MPSTLRQKTAETRRRHVLEAAVRVFGERGFRSATIRDVARGAGAEEGTIYNVFENKAALLLGLLDSLAGRSPSAAGPSPSDVPARSPDEAPPSSSDDPAGFLEKSFARRWESFTPEVLATLRTVLAEALTDPGLRAKFLAWIIMPPIDLAEPMFAAGMAQGSLALPDAAMTARALTALTMGMVMLRLLGEPEIECRSGEIPALLASLLSEGMRPRAPRVRREGTTPP